MDFQYPDARQTVPQPGSSRVVQSRYRDSPQSAAYIQPENPRFSPSFRDEYVYDDLSYSLSSKDTSDLYGEQFSGLDKQRVSAGNVQSVPIFREPSDLGFTENQHQAFSYEEPFYGSEDVSGFNLQVSLSIDDFFDEDLRINQNLKYLRTSEFSTVQNLLTIIGYSWKCKNHQYIFFY